MSLNDEALAAQLDALVEAGESLTYKGKGIAPVTFKFIVLRPGGGSAPSPVDSVNHDQALLEAPASSFPKRPVAGEEIAAADGTRYRIIFPMPTPISYRLTCAVS